MKKFNVHFQNRARWWVAPLTCAIVAVHILCDHEINWLAIREWIIDHGGVKSKWWYS